MANYIAVMKVGDDNRVAKSIMFETKREADKHISDHPEYPDAFSHVRVRGQASDWVVSGETISYDPLPKKPPPTNEEKMSIFLSNPLMSDLVDAIGGTVRVDAIAKAVARDA